MVEASGRALHLSAPGLPMNPIQEAEEPVLYRLVLSVKTTRIHPSWFASAGNCAEATRISTVSMLSPSENRHFVGSVTVHMSDSFGSTQLAGQFPEFQNCPIQRRTVQIEADQNR